MKYININEFKNMTTFKEFWKEQKVEKSDPRTDVAMIIDRWADKIINAPGGNTSPEARRLERYMSDEVRAYLRKMPDQRYAKDLAYDYNIQY